MTKKMRKELNLVIASSILYLISHFIPVAYLAIGFQIVAYLLVGYKPIRKAFRNILNGQVFDENFLMVLATFGAFMTKNYEEAVMVMVLYQVGELFQSYAVGKSRDSISNLMEINPEYANLCVGDEIEVVDPYEVNVGDIVVVKAGERIPLDGKVVEGQATIDAKALTGEAIPVEVMVGDEVISGCINQDGVLKVEVSKAYKDSTVAKILDLVENATTEKAPIENFVTKFARYYTPFVVVAALILGFVPPLFFGQSWNEYLLRACSFLVISCPCALVISIPLGFFAGIGSASKEGILVKGSNYIELLSQVKHIVFDKTGTLTKASFKTKKVVPINCGEKEFLTILATLESYSNHPIAKAIANDYHDLIKTDEIAEYNEIAGKGIKATFRGEVYYVGNGKLLKDQNIELPNVEEIDSIVYVASETKCLGYVTIGDQIKEGAIELVANLKNEEIQPYMLTGDQKAIGKNVAEAIGIKNYYCELLPQDKVEHFKEIKNNTKPDRIAFVGDGINDAPVLVAADVGIAMGGLGSDAAIEAADIVIMDDQISKITKAIKIADKTMGIVKGNIAFVLAVKFSVLILGAFGYADMWLAIFSDVGVSVIAIINSMRILGYKVK